jgi:uncharacterized protein
MNPLVALHYPTSSDADLDRLQALCEQLAGFDDTLSLEWLDGAMTALAAGPRQRPLIEWRDRLLGDTWSRAFADPQSDREASAVLQARWSVLLRQLDPEPLMEAPDDLRLAPVMLDWSEAGDVDGASADVEEAILVGQDAKEASVSGRDAKQPAGVHESAGETGAVDFAADSAREPRAGDSEDMPRTGEVWAIGFMEVVATFVEDWPVDIGTFGEQAEAFEDALARIAVLGLADENDIAQTVARLHPRTSFESAPVTSPVTSPEASAETAPGDASGNAPGNALEMATETSSGAALEAALETAPTRDELIEDALLAVQDLRLFFVENSPKPETRRVGPQPGRNDPCPCGSGRKFKKCHGA